MSLRSVLEAQCSALSQNKTTKQKHCSPAKANYSAIPWKTGSRERRALESELLEEDNKFLPIWGLSQEGSKGPAKKRETSLVYESASGLEKQHWEKNKGRLWS